MTVTVVLAVEPGQPSKTSIASAAGRAQQKKYVEGSEPWIFGFPDGLEREFVQSEGLEVVDLLPHDAPEARGRYLTRRDGSIAFPVPPPGREAPSQVGFMLEAAVPGR
jgi:hypothetical protein